MLSLFYAIELQLLFFYVVVVLFLLGERGEARTEDHRKELQAGEHFILLSSLALIPFGSRPETIKIPRVNTNTSVLE